MSYNPKPVLLSHKSSLGKIEECEEKKFPKSLTNIVRELESQESIKKFALKTQKTLSHLKVLLIGPKIR